MKRQGVQKQQKNIKKRKTTVSMMPLIPQKSMVIRPEVKAVDVTAAANFLSFASGAAVILLNGLILGSDRHNRIGRKVQISKLNTRLSLFQSGGSTIKEQDLLMMLVLDRDCEAALPTLDQIIQTTNKNGTPVTQILSQPNLNSTQRFQILRKKIISLRPTFGAAIAPAVMPNNFQDDSINWEWNVPMNVVTQFNSGNTGLVTDIENNALYLIYTTSLTSGTVTDFPSFQLSSRVRFYD